MDKVKEKLGSQVASDVEQIKSYEKVLALENWEQILTNVSPVDLCNVAMTSRNMNSVASRPQLWKGMKVNMGKVRKSGLAPMFAIKRYQKIKKLNFTDMVFTSEELKQILNDIPSSPLENVNFRRVNFSGMPAELLARAVSHLQTVNLARAVPCLQTANLDNTKLTTDQCVKVLEACISSKTLVNVDFRFVNLREVNAELLARAICHLQTVNLTFTRLITDQCVKVLEASISSTTLVNVDFSSVNLSKVAADLLARAVSRLQTVNLYDTKLTTDQCVKVLEACISSTTLVNVNFTNVNLSQVDAELLARAISRLQTANLCSTTKLTTDQCVKVLETCLSSKTLVNVDFMFVNLSKVNAELLATAVSHLQTVNLGYTKLSTDQCVKVGEACISSKTLVNVNLMGVDLSKVNAEQLAKAVSRLQTVNLNSTKLSTDQCVKVLEACISSKTLVNVDLEGVNLRENVPAELLASFYEHIDKIYEF